MTNKDSAGARREVLDLRRVALFSAAVVVIVALAVVLSQGRSGPSFFSSVQSPFVSGVLEFLASSQLPSVGIVQHGGNGSAGYNDLAAFGLTDTNITNSSQTGYVCSGANCNFTIVVESDNFTSTAATINFTNLTISNVYYNASDGSLRNVSELADIGQGFWNVTSGAINLTLAGGDGYDFGVRDSLPGGSYWLDSNGSQYGRFNISNDFITVGMDENDTWVYNNSGKVIFNTSFNDSVKLDGRTLASVYGSGVQNKTMYFFDWSNQTWKLWVKGASNANATQGMPNWLDPRNKQEFKWRYAFAGDNSTGRPGVNITFLMESSDPFVRTFVDTSMTTQAVGGTVTYSGVREIHTFTSSGSLNVTSGTNVKVLVVAAGGGGGTGRAANAGGGGGGGLIYNDSFAVSPGNYTIQVGTGSGGGKGGNSSFSTLIANGGGYGGTGANNNNEAGAPGGDGGSGGGGGTGINAAGGAGGSAVPAGQGNAGSAGTTNGAAGTGGGAGSSGASGGAGASYDISGSSVTYSAGGIQNGGSNGAANTGNGGGGGGFFSNTAGGSGIVIVSFPILTHNITIPFSLPENRTSVTTAEPGLVGYWNFNEGTGSTIYDESGNGNIGSWTNPSSNVTFSASCAFVNTYCLSANGVGGQWAQVADSPSLRLSNAVSISVWVYSRTQTKSEIVTKSSGDSNDNYRLVINCASTNCASGSQEVYFDYGNGAQYVISSTTIPLNSWVHIVGTVSAGGVGRLYFNGTEASYGAQGTAPSQLITGSDNLQIGGWSVSSHSCDCLIDDLKIYGRELNASEIKQLYSTGLNQQKPAIYFTSNNASSTEEVLFATDNFKNVNRSVSPSYFQIFSNQTNFFGFNYTFNSTLNQNFMFALGTMGRMNTTTFNPQTNTSQFSGETIESIANSTMTYYNLFDPSLMGWWKFNEGSGTTANDASSNNNTGTLVNSPSWVSNSSCKLNGCISFDGSSTRVNVTGFVNPPSITVEAWVNSRDASSEQMVVSKFVNNGANVQGFYAEMYQSRLNFAINGNVQLQGGTTLSSNTWYHIVATYDGATGTMTDYVNGNADGTKIASNGISDITSFFPMSIGAYTNAGSFAFNGLIDNVKIYRRALSADEVRADYLSTKEDYPNLRTINQTNGATSAATPTFYYDGGAAGIWHFDEGFGLNATDASGNGNMGTLVNGPTWMSNSSCKLGNCISFDGSNDYVGIPRSPSMEPSSSLTISSWIYLYGSQVSQAKILEKDYSRPNSPYISYDLDANDAGKLSFELTTGGSLTTLDSTTSPSNGIWYNLVGVYDGSKMYIYLNGVLENSVTKTGSVTYNTSRNVTIGANGQGAQPFLGAIDDVRIYPRALTGIQVRENYLQGPSKYYDDFGTAANGKTYEYYGVEDSNTSLQPITPSGTVLQYRFNTNSTSSVLDSSGSGNTGTINGAVTWITNSSCKNNFGGCIFVSNASSSYVDAGNNPSLQITGDLSVGAWIYQTADGDNFAHGVISKCTSSDLTCGFAMDTYPAPRLVRFHVGTGGAMPTTSAQINNNQWYFVTGTVSGNTVSLYINGTLADKLTYSGTRQNPSRNLLVGMYATDYTHIFPGFIDEAFVINRSLSPDEVYNMYLGGAQRHGGDLVGWWRFNDNTTGGNVTLDSSGNGNTGVLNGANDRVNPLWVNNASCKINGCLYFRGGVFNVGGPWVDVGNSSVFDMTDFTMEAWVKYNSTADSTGALNDQRIISRDSISAASGRDIFVMKSTSQAANGGLVPGGPVCYVQIRPGSTSALAAYAISTADNNWHNIMCVRKAGVNLSIFVDGVLVNQTTDPDAGKFDGGTSVAIGAGTYGSPGASENFNGTIDNVKIWKRALTVGEITEEYRQTQDQYSQYGAIHRVASADSMQGASYNLTDHDSFSQTDYDQRRLLISGVNVQLIDNTAPTITVQSPQSSVTTTSIWANVTLNEAGSYCGESLDGAANVTLTNSSGNWNLLMTGVSSGAHTVTFYCNDTSGNMGSQAAPFTVSLNTLVITGRSLYALTGLPLLTGTVRAILDSGEANYTTISNGNWQVSMAPSANLSASTSGVGIFVNDSSGKSGYYRLVIGNGNSVTPSTACATNLWRFNGIVSNPSTGQLSPSGNVTVKIEGKTFSNTTSYSNGFWDVYLSPCLIPGSFFTADVQLTDSSGRTGLITLKEVAK